MLKFFKPLHHWITHRPGGSNRRRITDAGILRDHTRDGCTFIADQMPPTMRCSVRSSLIMSGDANGRAATYEYRRATSRR